MYYSYNYSDFNKCEREPYEYYTLEQLKAYVPLEAHNEPYYPDGGWCIYSADSRMSCEPLDCKSEDEAYENLLEAKNISLYERWHDL